MYIIYNNPTIHFNQFPFQLLQQATLSSNGKLSAFQQVTIIQKSSMKFKGHKVGRVQAGVILLWVDGMQPIERNRKRGEGMNDLQTSGSVSATRRFNLSHPGIKVGGA